MERMGKKWIALCSTAIGIVYASGYFINDHSVSAGAPSVMETMAANPSVTEAPTIKKKPEVLQGITGEGGHERGRTKRPGHIDEGLQHKEPNASANNQPRSTVQPSAPSPTPSKPGAALTYKDGTFSGSGTNRFGTVKVDVTIQKGQIANVIIAECSTRYPQRYIDSLPDEVKKQQSAHIDSVSGATRSSEDFIAAVMEALSKAQA
ncbi:FMN-binding protein [Paenibacillus sp. RC67]|uniref:FMN-binding protein n=1 Tax=Paenibacillus sp. RC67 TaxID=3039392 RepID=UPI0024AE8011|nr:FMN-binding protein [Paenibacillus sp. RC67]